MRTRCGSFFFGVFALLLVENQGVAGRRDQAERVSAWAQICSEAKHGFNCGRPLRPVMEECFGPPRCPDMDLKPTLHHFIYQLEKTDEVRLPGLVRADEDVKRT